MSDRISRREFIGRSAAAGVGLAVLGQAAASADESAAKSRVVAAWRNNACADMEPNAAVVGGMVDAAVMRLSGKTTPGQAWASFVKPDDVVGIKINGLFGIGAATHPEVAQAVAMGCKLAGVPAEKIIIWDRTDADLTKSGYETNRGAGVQCYGVQGEWEEKPVAIHTIQGRLAKLLTRTCTAIINVPILKSHGVSGITMSMKNHYGSFHNPGEAHANGCDPFIAHLNNLPVIRQKTRLIICDALLPISDGGPHSQPQWTWEQNTILAATDPVAIDYMGLRILDAQRAKLNMPSLEKSGRARHIFTAASMGLGVADLDKIEYLKA